MREALVADFVNSTSGYLEHPDFVRRFVARRLEQRVTPGSPYPV